MEDWGDRAASSLGAKVGEQQLGQSEEADELIHGRTGDIAASVKSLRDFGAAFGLVGQGLKSLDSGHWKGEAAEALRERFESLPTDWLHAADAFEDAAGALETYALGRATSKNADGAITTYEYDLTDGLTRTVGPDTTLTLLRDRFGRLTSETVADRTTSYTYDALGRRTGRTTGPGRRQRTVKSSSPTRSASARTRSPVAPGVRRPGRRSSAAPGTGSP